MFNELLKCETPIEYLDLEVRTYNVLRRSDINTIGDTVSVLNSKDKMQEIKNFDFHIYTNLCRRLRMFVNNNGEFRKMLDEMIMLDSLLDKAQLLTGESENAIENRANKLALLNQMAFDNQFGYPAIVKRHDEKIKS